MALYRFLLYLARHARYVHLLALGVAMCTFLFITPNYLLHLVVPWGQLGLVSAGVLVLLALMVVPVLSVCRYLAYKPKFTVGLALRLGFGTGCGVVALMLAAVGFGKLGVWYLIPITLALWLNMWGNMATEAEQTSYQSTHYVPFANGYVMAVLMTTIDLLKAALLVALAAWGLYLAGLATAPMWVCVVGGILLLLMGRQLMNMYNNRPRYRR